MSYGFGTSLLCMISAVTISHIIDGVRLRKCEERIAILQATIRGIAKRMKELEHDDA